MTGHDETHKKHQNHVWNYDTSLRNYDSELLYTFIWLKPCQVLPIRGRTDCNNVGKEGRGKYHARPFHGVPFFVVCMACVSYIVDTMKAYRTLTNPYRTLTYTQLCSQYLHHVPLYLSLSVPQDAPGILLSPLPPCLHLFVDLRVDRQSRARTTLRSSN